MVHFIVKYSEYCFLPKKNFLHKLIKTSDQINAVYSMRYYAFTVPTHFSTV